MTLTLNSSIGHFALLMQERMTTGGLRTARLQDESPLALLDMMQDDFERIQSCILNGGNIERACATLGLKLVILNELYFVQAGGAAANEC